MLYFPLFAVAIVVFIGAGVWYFRLRREQTVELTIEPHGPLPPPRAVIDEARHDAFGKMRQKHVTRFKDHEKRISDEDARALVGLYFDLDPSWKNPEIAHNYNVWFLARVSLQRPDNTPREDIEVTIEGSRTDPVCWDALAWTFARTEGKRPLGQALHRWVRDVMHGQCPRPKGGKGSRGPARRMSERNYVISWAVHILTECGMHATRNELTDAMENPSACDIVAGVLKERNHSVRTYSAAVAIWQGKR